MVSGQATVTGANSNPTATTTMSGNTIAIDLSNVVDGQMLSLGINNLTDNLGRVLPATTLNWGVLIGDTSGNGMVNATDVAQTKSQTGAPVTQENFRQDVTPNAAINASDVGLVKSRSGAQLP